MWWRGEKKKLPTVCDGGSFRRLHRLGFIEIAKVIAVVRDETGISHVQFNLEFADRLEHAFERRTLALDHFQSLYTETVD